MRVREKQCGDRQPLDGSFWSGPSTLSGDPKLKLTAVLMANLNDVAGGRAASAQFERDAEGARQTKIALSYFGNKPKI
ncbi:MAG: hypothetical protein ACLS4Z_11520 [Christensenellaceae bacterium]